jgi:hypothetical protein
MAPTSLRTALDGIGEPKDPCTTERDALVILENSPPELDASFLTSPDAFAAAVAEWQAKVATDTAALETCVKANKKKVPSRIPADFRGPRPATIQQVVRACLSPRMSAWTNPERPYAENQDWTEELNGLVTDGNAWYASCNANDDREGLYKLSMTFQVERKLAHPFDVDDVHIGALAIRGGHIYVPMQQEQWGVWVVDNELAGGRFLPAAERPEDDMFAWCDLNPHNGLIYTCNFTLPSSLYAYQDAGDKLVRAVAHDIPLHQPGDGKATTKIQSGCFTPNFKWLATCDVDGDERIHCHSTLTGSFLDRRQLLADTDESPLTRNELEGIWYTPIHTGQGNHVQVHVLELNNEIGSGDDMYLWQFSLPRPDAL